MTNKRKAEIAKWFLEGAGVASEKFGGCLSILWEEGGFEYPETDEEEIKIVEFLSPRIFDEIEDI